MGPAFPSILSNRLVLPGNGNETGPGQTAESPEEPRGRVDPQYRREPRADAHHAVVQDVQSYEDLHQTLALLKILAMGQKTIEAGQCMSAGDVFAEIERLDREEGVK